MSFDVSQLKSDLYNAFQQMESDDDFADGLSKAIKDFGESGDITTVDAGQVSSGTFSGSGSGGLKLTDSLCSAPIKIACQSMLAMTEGGDTVLANAIGNGVQAMVSAGTVETDVVGTTIAPPPTSAPVPPYSGKAKGTISCQNASLIAKLISVFSDMKSRYDEEGFDGDDYLADEMSKEVKSYFTSGIISTNGTGELSGTTGSGSIS